VKNGILIESFENQILKAIEPLWIDKNVVPKLGKGHKLLAGQKFN
jgi:hypothetical protein